ncbi:MAG: 50S ribosomal protein L3 [Mycoplasmataceae bacterium]|jgi:large subunit ribosomal protein L3|nr:50S ribosomal protein L3 [Mycoplasmataceae bacterium]
MKSIVGTKVGMMQIFDVAGKQLAATVIHCPPNKVLEIKTPQKHGHTAVKIGCYDVDEKKVNKSVAGIFKKVNVKPARYIRTLTTDQKYQVGDEIKVDTFTKGEFIDVQGVTKGHGFTGAIKRWNFKIGPLSHGAGFPHRYQGSVAFGRGGSQAQRVMKGKKMAGRYGHETVTMQNLLVLESVLKRNILIVLGAIPGPAGSLVTVKSAVKKPQTAKKIYQIVTKELQEIIQEQNKELENKEALHQAEVASASSTDSAPVAKTEVKTEGKEK